MRTASPRGVVIGGGITGLAAGMASGFPVLEADQGPGGICRSYYLRTNGDRLAARPDDGQAYRFEVGGGHWIFGGDPAVVSLIEGLTPMRRYQRKSAVYFAADDRWVPYPLQNNLHALAPSVARPALSEMVRPGSDRRTMRSWHESLFGPTLSELFFHPFHERYTAGLHGEIAPQDPYKSPIQLEQVIAGALGEAEPVGYNTSYLYPEAGLDSLARAMAERCDITYHARVVGIDPQSIRLENGQTVPVRGPVISTLPLPVLVRLLGIDLDGVPPPHTSVLVLNIGGVRGPACPREHWVYTPDARSGFHRVGFYSNVDASFVPGGAAELASLYVERSFTGGARPDSEFIAAYAEQVVEELVGWGFLERASVVDPTWIDVAYTWRAPGSNWHRRAMHAVAERNVITVGRYGRWVFQGIADSLRDGLAVGAAAAARRA